MNLYKKTLIALSIISIVATANANTVSSFAELEQAKIRINQPLDAKVAEFHQYVNSYLDEYEVWRTQYNKALDQQRNELIAQWGSGEVSDQTKSVEYSDNNTVKKVIDYEKNTATISLLIDNSESVSNPQDILEQHIISLDGLEINLDKATISFDEVNYSSQKEQQEKSFIIEQFNSQTKELDIQADRLILTNIGIPDSFIYERAHNKKLALLSETKTRLTHITQFYQSKRQELGIVSVDLPPIVSESVSSRPVITIVTDVAGKPATIQAPASNEVASQVSASQQQHPSEPIKNDSELQVVASTTASVTQQLQTSEPIKNDSELQVVVSTPASATQQQQPSEPIKDDSELQVVILAPADDAAKASTTDKALQASQKKIVNYTVTLPNKSLNNRASQYQPYAQQESKKWGIDEAVIMAIMHSESSFRPDAKSHVPAFGLMQVVPVSAGHDVNKLIRNIDAPMKAEDLYVPPLNVETGAAYLYILNDKYLRKIEDKQSRLYCMISAYNTGAGNVARAFNKDRSTNISKAAEVINKMTPDQVYDHLLKQLPYDETKNYLKKVTERIALYQ